MVEIKKEAFFQFAYILQCFCREEAARPRVARTEIPSGPRSWRQFFGEKPLFCTIWCHGTKKHYRVFDGPCLRAIGCFNGVFWYLWSFNRETSRACTSGMKFDVVIATWPDFVRRRQECSRFTIDSKIIAQAPSHGGRTLCVTAARWRVCHAPPHVRSSSRGLQVNPLHPFRCTRCNAKNVAVTSQMSFLEMCMHCYTIGYMCLRDFCRLLIILGYSPLSVQRVQSLWTKPHGLLVNSVG